MKRLEINKKAELLTENTMFIILNLVFFAILAVFIFIKANDPAILEEAYAKKIALVLDAARPGMEINISMESALKQKDKDYTGKIVNITGNLVTVKLRQKGGYSYSFFNDVSPDPTYSYPKDEWYFFTVEPYKKAVEVTKSD